MRHPISLLSASSNTSFPNSCLGTPSWSTFQNNPSFPNRSLGTRNALGTLDRRAFTLVELLVVIAIIGVLAALAVSAVFKYIDAQRVTTTENTLRSFDKVLTTQWKKVVDEAIKEDFSPAVFALANNNAYRARILWIKFRLAEAFPQSYAEIITANGPNGFYNKNNANGPWIPIPKYMPKYLRALPAVMPASHVPGTESAACLYLALSVSRGGVVLDEGNMAHYIGDTDGDGVKELLDSWGKAIQFQRFPIGNTALAALNPRAGANPSLASLGDPLDPDGVLQQQDITATAPWYSTGSGAAFTSLCNHPFPAAPLGPQPYWIPFISSDGRDQITGTSDDLYSYLLKIGVKGY